MLEKVESSKNFQHIKELKIIIYKELHLNASNKNTSVIDEWINQKKYSSVEIEKVLNHIHIYDFFPEIQEEKKLDEIAKAIALSWKQTLLRLDSRYRILAYRDYGPEITFYFERPEQEI